MQRALPLPALVLIAIATALLWLGVLGLLIGIAFSGPGMLSIDNLFGTPLEDTNLRYALWLQWGTLALSYLVTLVMGTIILGSQFQGRPEAAASTAIVFVRLLIVFAAVNVFTSSASSFAIGGVIAGLPVVLTVLPSTLISIAFLICAERYLQREPEGIFS